MMACNKLDSFLINEIKQPEPGLVSVGPSTTGKWYYWAGGLSVTTRGQLSPFPVSNILCRDLREEMPRPTIIVPARKHHSPDKHGNYVPFSPEALTRPFLQSAPPRWRLSNLACAHENSAEGRHSLVPSAIRFH